jgi:hypothetical protein
MQKFTCKGISGRESQGDWRQDELIGGKPPVVNNFDFDYQAVERESAGWQSVESCSCEKWEAGCWGQGQFGNPEEEVRPPLEAATKQRSKDRDWEH